jgi:membrane protein required for colicin V production
MTAFDFSVIAIIALSVLLGWWRGFMYELFSLIGWVVSYIVAVTFTAQATPYIPETVGSESIRSGVAFAALFVTTLVVSGIAAWLLAKLAKFAGLAGLDGKFGAMFGVLRGLLVVLALVWLGGLTKLPQQPWWRDAWTSKPLLQAALFAKDYLPDESLQK